MSERSRDEKLAAAKKKLKKYQENTSKWKSNTETSCTVVKNKKESQISNSLLDSRASENQNIIHNNENIENIGTTLESLQPVDEPTATTESLKQISRHLNGIISRSSSSIDRESQQEYLNTIRDLEKRNVELASLNSQKAEQLEFLNSKLANLNEGFERMTKEYNGEKSNLENSFRKQNESTRTQLQAQIHTISLLVAEKSELQSQVTHNQKLANQRYQEIEDLTNKLKISRQKVGDLEKSFNEIKMLNDKSEEIKRDMARQIEQTRNDLKKTKSEKEDLIFECSQLRSKLMSKTQEISNLELTLDDIKSELEMSQVQIQHLTNNQEGHYDNLCSQLKLADKKNAELLNDLELAKLNLQQAEAQNNRLQVQYRSYFDQLEERLRISQAEIQLLTQSKYELNNQLEEVKMEITKIKLTDDSEVCNNQNLSIILESENATLVKKLELLETSNLSLKENNATLVNDNAHLLTMVKDFEIKNADLVEKIKQCEINQLDYTQLLNQLQSDKTALSRALAQNKQLKSQLIELQEAFVKLSSDNMDYSTQLQHEKHVSKELATRLGEQEDELNELRQLINRKDEEITKLINSNRQITEELLTINNNAENNLQQRSELHFQMANKLVIENLQTDLINSQERINQLTTENNDLKFQLNQNIDNFDWLEVNKNSNTEMNDLIISLRQIEAERDELLTKNEMYLLKQNELIYNLNELKDVKNEDSSLVTKEEFTLLQNLYYQINEQLQKETAKNANLTKQNFQLEHLVEQLEGETDTIAEYINLYQHQRSLLKQKCATRDQLMSRLTHQKQLLENKLASLENMLIIALKSNNNNISLSSPYPINSENAQMVDQIFTIIKELRLSGDMITDNCEISDGKEGKQLFESFDSNFLSDDLLHYHIIHCKCCIGKVIDL